LSIVGTDAPSAATNTPSVATDAAPPKDTDKEARESDYGQFYSKKAISRRTVLRGIGATMALPLLDAMIPDMEAAPKPGVPVWARSICQTE